MEARQVKDETEVGSSIPKRTMVLLNDFGNKVFPVVMYGYKSWTIKKAEHQRIDAFDLWCWR